MGKKQGPALPQGHKNKVVTSFFTAYLLRALLERQLDGCLPDSTSVSCHKVCENLLEIGESSSPEPCT
jgi:hypothetical protein